MLDDGTLAEESFEIIHIGRDDRCLKKIYLRLADALHQINAFSLQVIRLRGCLKTCQTREAADHEMDHGHSDHGLTGLGVVFVILVYARRRR